MKEYKLVKVKWDLELKRAEEIMNEMAQEGWEVVCMSTEPAQTMLLIITFSRTRK